MTNKTKIFLAHSNDPFNQNELDSIEEMIKYYPSCEIQITIYYNDEFYNKTTENTTIATILREKRSVTTESQINPDKITHKNTSTGYLLDFFIQQNRRRKNKRKIIVEKITTKPKLQTLNDLLSKYNNIICHNLSMEYIFENSPLYMVYKKFTPQLTTFAIRTLQLWDYGGISFALPETYDVSISLHNADDDESIKILKLIELGYNSYKKLADGLVTIDDEGLHMETKTTCHSFFGEMIQFLRHSVEGTTIQQIIKLTLKSFCNRGAVDSDYCNNLI